MGSSTYPPYALGLGWVAALSALGFVLFASVMTLVEMTRYAAHNVGKGYAARHLVLAVLLAPVLLAGVLLVSRLVEADIERWHLMADRARTGADAGTDGE